MQCFKYLPDQRKKLHLLASSARHHWSFPYKGLPQCLIVIAYSFHPEVTDPVLFTIWSGSPSQCKKNTFLCSLEAQHVQVTCFDQWQMSGSHMYCIKMEHLRANVPLSLPLLPSYINWEGQYFNWIKWLRVKSHSELQPNQGTFPNPDWDPS